MTEKLTGIVGSCELPPGNERFRAVVTGVLLRPIEEWKATMTLKATIKLILPDGRVFMTRIKGGEFRSQVPKDRPIAILVEDIPELENQIPVGTKMFVDEPE